LSAGNFTRWVGPAVGWVYLIRTGRHGYSLFVCTVTCYMMLIMLIMCARETGKQPKANDTLPELNHLFWFNSRSILINFLSFRTFGVSAYLDATLSCSPLRSMPATPAPTPPSAYMAAVIESASESSCVRTQRTHSRDRRIFDALELLRTLLF